MRLDKFLKVSRIIKRRTIAKEVTDKGRVQINGQVAKASSTVKIDDEISIQFGQKKLIVRVLDIKETSKKENAQEMFEVVSEGELIKEDK